ncbi:MAG: MazG family protein, partial [Chloroflexota bacterium]|nr:MazG family protein [Chloroflexota bacterium]
MTQTADPTAADFDALLAVMRRLRDPQAGCPWDLEQTHLSLRNTLVEEAYEALEAIDSGETDAMVEELGDLMFQTVFHAQIGADEGRFTIRDVLVRLTEKLVRRHPHVFADATAG